MENEPKDTRIIFNLSKQEVVIEGAETALIKILQAVKEVAPLFSEIRIIGQPNNIAASGPSSLPAASISQDRKPPIRDFARSLHLSNTYERIAALAYHAIKIEGKASFAVKEMDAWFGLCGFKKPANMAVAFSDSKRRYGYLDSKGRDQWTISTGGENALLEKLENRRGVS